MNITKLPVTRRGNGNPIVLLHGLGGNKHQWEEFIPQDLPFGILMPDLPGHGEADSIPPNGCSFTSFAGEVINLITMETKDNPGKDQFIIGGISMGAGVALSIALLMPEKIRGLILIRPAWLNMPRPQNLEILNRLGTFLMHNSVEETRLWFLKDDLFKRLEIENKACAASVLSQLNRPDPLLAARTLTDMTGSAPFNEFTDLEKLTFPVLVAGSHADPLHPIAMARTLADCIPGSVFEEIPSRYTQQQEHLKQVRSLLSSFLTQF
jgi:pimeloyl-ACP methyl ester carboxylesterase